MVKYLDRIYFLVMQGILGSETSGCSWECFIKSFRIVIEMQQSIRFDICYGIVKELSFSVLLRTVNSGAGISLHVLVWVLLESNRATKYKS